MTDTRTLAVLLIIAALGSGAIAQGDQVEVTDGDSLKIDGKRTRLHGIDAPEKGQTCIDQFGKPFDCGLTASRALQIMITGRKVECTKVNIDRFGRTVATCTADGKDLGELMVRGGFAVDYSRYSKGKYGIAELEARENKRGLWSGTFDLPERHRRERGQ